MNKKFTFAPPAACPVCEAQKQYFDNWHIAFACGQMIGVSSHGTWTVYYGYCANTVSVIETLRRELDDLRTRVGMLED